MCNCYLISRCAWYKKLPSQQQGTEKGVGGLPPVARSSLCISSPWLLSLVPLLPALFKTNPLSKNAEDFLCCRCIFDEQLWLPLTFMTNSLYFIWLPHKKSHLCSSTVESLNVRPQHCDTLGFSHSQEIEGIVKPQIQKKGVSSYLLCNILKTTAQWWNAENSTNMHTLQCDLPQWWSVKARYNNRMDWGALV